MPDFFTGGLGIKLWSSCLQGKCFTGCPPGPAPFLSKHTTGLHFLETVVLNASLADHVFLGRQKQKQKQVHSRGCRITSQTQELQEPAASLLMSLKQNKTLIKILHHFCLPVPSMARAYVHRTGNVPTLGQVL